MNVGRDKVRKSLMMESLGLRLRAPLKGGPELLGLGKKLAGSDIRTITEIH